MTRQLQPGQVEDRERCKGLSGGVDGVLAERQIRWVAEDFIKHVVASRRGRR
jgi:hypothetical protein